MTDSVELSAALRYDRDDRELTIMAPAQFLPVFAFPSGRSGDVRTADFDSVQPKVTLSWQPNEDWTVYGTYAEGFRSGGFNLSGVAVGVATLAGAGVPGLPQGVRDSYDQEDTEGFEIGFKSSLLGGALRWDAAVFDTEVENGFTFVFVAPFTAQTTRNIRSADVTGLETSVAWLAASACRSTEPRVPRLGDHRERLGRRRRHQHHRQGNAAKSRLDGELGTHIRRSARRRPRMVRARRLPPARRGLLGA